MAGVSITWTPTAAAYDISALGFDDWALWTYAAAGDTSLAPEVRKSGGGSTITNMVATGSGLLIGFSAAIHTVSWTGGTPTASGSNNNAVYNNANSTGTTNTGMGCSTTLPADTSQREARYYVATYGAAVTLTATLSDGSAGPGTNTSLSDPGVSGTGGYYTITYSANSAAQTLTLQATVTTANSAYADVEPQGVGWKFTGGSPDVTVGLAGVAGTAAVGTIGNGQAIGLAGNAGSGAIGTLALAVGKALAGNAGTGAVGTISTAKTIALTGVSGTGAVGDVAVLAGSDVSVALAGVEGLGQVGDLVASKSGEPVTVALLGVEGVGQIGVLTASGGDAPVGPVNENDIGGGQRRQVYWRPLLQRMLDARAEDRPPPPKGRAKVRAKAIEQDAARLVLEGDASVAKFNALLERWTAQHEVEAIPADPLGAFAAAMRMRVEQAGEVGRLSAIAEQAKRKRDDDEAAILLLLT